AATKISPLPRGAFAEVTQVSSLWLAHNEIAAIEPGALAVLVQLKNLDISHNQIAEFPWQDLRNLSALQLLKMNNNRMALVPQGAFRTLKDLRSLRINNNRFATLPEGVFDSLGSLSHLQIYNNPFECSCALQWLKRWMESTLISIPEKDSIACALPERLRGVPLAKGPGLDCGRHNALHCPVTGSPPPELRWKIRTAGQSLELSGSPPESAGKEQPQQQEPERFLVFKNGTLVIPHLSKREEGTYTCVATNELGSNHTSVNRRGHALVQWSRIEAGVNSYWFQGLNPGTNYSVCLSYLGEECQVQVVFSTKKEIPSLIIIVVVSIFLLLLATLPLLGATWCHLLAKLHGKPYKLIMKAQNPDQMEKRMAADFDPRASYLESEKNFEPGPAGAPPRALRGQWHLWVTSVVSGTSE
ncbi:PREDICTED: immunoglobulin superfamily containing leucine-rich repeat protein 2, partial [Corvus brachyrhynchos]|uniref:immunoglobulin superfamily containing leucine-rich repeat protein 2 n=1 Tax=Corvus brachyrhynchos TaxID=85066 RepID=UPI0004DDE34F